VRSGGLARIGGVSVSVQVEAVEAGSETLDVSGHQDGGAGVVLVQGHQAAHQSFGGAGRQGAAGGGAALGVHSRVMMRGVHVHHGFRVVVLKYMQICVNARIQPHVKKDGKKKP